MKSHILKQEKLKYMKHMSELKGVEQARAMSRRKGESFWHEETQRQVLHADSKQLLSS